MRQLVPHYFVSTQPLGWRCSECGQPFALNVPVISTSEDIPLPIKVLFNSHKCRKRSLENQPRSES
jgi:hypothetical protein